MARMLSGYACRLGEGGNIEELFELGPGPVPVADNVYNWIEVKPPLGPSQVYVDFVQEIDGTTVTRTHIVGPRQV